jgi:NAD-dependent deacetylase
MQVYPAAGLIDFVNNDVPVYFIDPEPSISKDNRNELTILKSSAADGLPKLVQLLLIKEA